MSMNINITKQPRAQVKKYSIEDIKQLFEHAIKKKMCKCTIYFRKILCK